MAKKNTGKPSALELLILKVLWKVDEESLPMAVRDIRDLLEEHGRPLAHTSVITVLNIMVTKKFLRRSKRKNAFYFSPKLKQEAAETRAIGEVLNHVFDGSAQSLMLALLGHDDVGPDDLAQLHELIEQKIKQGME